MMNLDNIEKQLEFLKLALHGGDILLREPICMSYSEINKVETDNDKIKQEIDELERRKINIIRKQKIKKITDG